VGEYEATETFQSVPKHTAVMQRTPKSKTGLLIAVTGPAGDARALADALLMAAAPDLLKATLRAIEMLQDETRTRRDEREVLGELLDAVFLAEVGVFELEGR